MTKREEIFTYVKDKYGTEPDYPWVKFPNYAVLRHSEETWYGLIMNVPKEKLGLPGDGSVDVIDLKGDPDFIDDLKSKDGVLPAYHMNKKHWISIVLDSSFPTSEIYHLIDSSFELTKG
jgi:predicted DNA-binding protein (MmcQ/YjbR family)